MRQSGGLFQCERGTFQANERFSSLKTTAKVKVGLFGDKENIFEKSQCQKRLFGIDFVNSVNAYWRRFRLAPGRYETGQIDLNSERL